jgi:hypothetical protein
MNSPSGLPTSTQNPVFHHPQPRSGQLSSSRPLESYRVISRMELFGGGWDTAHSITGRSRPPLETQMSSNSTNPSAYSPKSFLLLAQNSRASSDNRMSSLACVQNCRAASRASSQTSNVFAVACGSINSISEIISETISETIDFWSTSGIESSWQCIARSAIAGASGSPVDTLHRVG